MDARDDALTILQKLSHIYSEMNALDRHIDALETERLRYSDQALALHLQVLGVLRANPKAEAIDCGHGQILIRAGEVYQLFPVTNLFTLNEPAGHPQAENADKPEDTGDLDNEARAKRHMEQWIANSRNKVIDRLAFDAAFADTFASVNSHGEPES